MVDSIAHSRGVHLLLLLLLEVAYAVDGGEGVVGVGHPDTHGVILIGYRGAGADAGIQDVLAFGHEAPLAILGGIAERGIDSEIRGEVIETLNALGLEVGVEEELNAMFLRKLGNKGAAKHASETGAVDGQVKELNLVVAV